MLFYCWADVEDSRPTLKQHLINVSCLLGAVPVAGEVNCGRLLKTPPLEKQYYIYLTFHSVKKTMHIV